MIKNIFVELKRGVPKAVRVIYTQGEPLNLDFDGTPRRLSTEDGEFDRWLLGLGGGYVVEVHRRAK